MDAVEIIIVDLEDANGFYGRGFSYVLGGGKRLVLQAALDRVAAGSLGCATFFARPLVHLVSAAPAARWLEDFPLLEPVRGLAEANF